MFKNKRKRRDIKGKAPLRHSLKMRLSLFVAALIAALIIGNSLSNNYLLESYYINEKLDKLSQSYHTISQLLLGGAEYSEINEVLSRMRERQGISGVAIYKLTSYKNVYDLAYNSFDFNQSEVYYNQFRIYVNNLQDDSIETMKSTDDYIIYKTAYQDGSTNYLDFVGKIDGDNYYIFVRIPAQNISETVDIYNRYYAEIGMITLLVGVILAFIVASKLAAPLQQLCLLVSQMADANFSLRYEEKRKDEIGILGGEINNMAIKLEQNILELKHLNEELQKDIHKKEIINQMQQEFISNVSHELKTPIALIRGYAEGLQEFVDDDAESRAFYCEVIEDEAIKMNHIVQNLLLLGRIETGERELTVLSFDIVEVLKNIIRTYKLLVDEKGAEVLFHTPVSQKVRADEQMIEEVLRNYLNNALNHLDGEKKIEINVRKEADKVRVEIGNSGTPIPETELSHIWDRFYKVDKARTRAYGGSGIGLSIVKAIMDLHDKSYGAYNRGETVIFWLELEASEDELSPAK